MRCAFACVILLSLAANAAEARDIVVLNSEAPYWQVGERDEALSRACALGRFEPAHTARLTARFTGKEGSGLLEIAKGSGLNLYDRDRRAKPREDYFFRRANTSSCEVFVGGRGAKRG